MQLTQFSDYSLRVVLYLAAQPDRIVTVREVSDAYGISAHHLVKVTTRLIELGVVISVRGRNGGLRLGRPAHTIDVGALVRATEPHFNLVECFDPATNTCPIDGACRLKVLLRDAQEAFLRELDGHTVTELLSRAPTLMRLWRSRREAEQGSVVSRAGRTRR